MVKFNYQLVGITGEQGWLERYTGAGSTYFVYKLLGISIVIGGLLYASGFGDNVASFFFSPLRGIFQNGLGG